MADSTLVILTADHGEEFFEHGSVLHGRSYFEEVIRVPLLLRGPGVPAGLRTDNLASLVDVVPTALGLLGLPIPDAVQGVDLSLAWREGTAQGPEGTAQGPEGTAQGPEGTAQGPKGTAQGREAVLAEADRGLAVPGRYRMLRTDRHKLILDSVGGEARIYDLRDDPMEKQPVADAALARSLINRLEAMTEEPRQAPAAPPLSAEQREMLQRLGYGDGAAASGSRPPR
jgi:arylsulfatase A-like enzyme